MKKITFQLSREPNSLTTVLILFTFLCISGTTLAQTISNVFPTRVTTRSVVTVVGNGFTPTTAVFVTGLTTSNLTYVSPTEMTFQISENSIIDISGAINVNSVPTSFVIEYVAPTEKVLRNGPTSNVTKITEIFTTYNGFWRSSEYKNDPGIAANRPNDNHDLLGFTYGGVTYSTGVNDQLLTDNGITFNEQLFFAYTTDGVSGTTQALNFLAVGDIVDGEVGEGIEITSPEILGTTIYDAITDGVNGLNLGTGVTNFNQTDDVRFFSSGGNLGAVDDVAPDFLITQIAAAGSTDIYYYADADENVVGRPIKLSIEEEAGFDGDALIAEWRLDLFNFPNGINYGLATPSTRAFTSEETRPLRMVAFRMEEFGINSSNVFDINNINLVAGGTSDLAFLAYNRGSFDIKTPVFSQFPVSRYICEIPSSSDVTFVSVAELSGAPTGDPLETLSYQWFRYNQPIPGATNSSYTISGGLDESDLVSYRVRVSNGFGAIVAQVTLNEGGTPTFWDGTSWVLPPSYIAAGITVNDNERDLIFSEDYTQSSGVLEGCECNVPLGSDVTFSSDATLKLINELNVTSGGTLTLEDDAKIIQTRVVTGNSNTGSIIVEREVTSAETGDFIFWSSPVTGTNLSNITEPFASTASLFDVNEINGDGFAGDFVTASGNSVSGRGYLISVPTEFVPDGFDGTFQGRAANGPINTNIFKSPSATQPDEELRHWNLIGNPYPSAINVEEFLSTNIGIEGNIRIWSNGNTNNTSIAGEFYPGVNYDYTDNYVTYNRTGSTPDVFGGNISSGQGFFVQISESTGPVATMNFRNTMRYDDVEVAYDNSQFIQTNESSSVQGSPANQKIWLSLVSSSNESSVALIGYVNGATNAKDRMYDAFSDGSDMRIYSTLNSSKLAIQGRALPFDVDDFVRIGVDLPNTGGYSIGIDQLQGNIFGGSQDIFLQDVLLDVVHDLRSGPYSFTGISGSTTDRFILKYTSEPLSIDNPEESETFAFISNNTLNVQSAMAIQDITVYDVTGKEIVVYTPNSSETSFVTPFNFSRGLYIAVIKVGDGNTIKVTRKLLN